MGEESHETNLNVVKEAPKPLGESLQGENESGLGLGDRE